MIINGMMMCMMSMIVLWRRDDDDKIDMNNDAAITW